jgi:hypothetical protein
VGASQSLARSQLIQIGVGSMPLAQPTIATLEMLGTSLFALMLPRAQRIVSLKELVPNMKTHMVSKLPVTASPWVL